MNLRLALMTATRPADCTVRLLDDPEERLAQYSRAMQGRIRVFPHQLVAVDVMTTPPTVVWRWFRGVVVYRREAYVVVDNHVYQPGAPIPLSLLRLPDILEVDVQVGDEVFSSHDPQGVVIDVVQEDRPAHPARIATDLFPAIVEVYADRHAQGET